MVDEPYVPLLPWIVFGIVEGVNRHGMIWASLGAFTVALVLLFAPRRFSVELPNVLMLGAAGWFAALGIVGWAWADPGTWLARNSLALSAIGFTVIAFASLAGTPFTEYWTRLGARRRHWSMPSFHRANVQTSMLWGALFAVAAASHLAAAAVATKGAQTIFNWLVPLAAGVVAAWKTRQIWVDFVDETFKPPAGPETLWGLSYDDEA